MKTSFIPTFESLCHRACPSDLTGMVDPIGEVNVPIDPSGLPEVAPPPTDGTPTGNPVGAYLEGDGSQPVADPMMVAMFNEGGPTQWNMGIFDESVLPAVAPMPTVGIPV